MTRILAITACLVLASCSIANSSSDQVTDSTQSPAPAELVVADLEGAEADGLERACSEMREAAVTPGGGPIERTAAVEARHARRQRALSQITEVSTSADAVELEAVFARAVAAEADYLAALKEGRGGRDLHRASVQASHDATSAARAAGLASCVW